MNGLNFVDRRNDPNHKGMTVYLKKELIASLKAWCARNDVTLSEVVEELVIQKLHPTNQTTFESLLSGKDLSLLVKPAGLPIERLEAIASGAKPCDNDIVGLSRALQKTSDELLAIRRKIFGNGTKSGVCHG